MANEALPGKRIIIADDSPLVGQALAGRFRELGMDVVFTATSGVTAFEAAKKHRPDIVCLDIMMPDMDGIECATLLRTQMPQLAIVFCTVLASDMRFRDAIGQRFSKQLFMHKPPSNDEAATAITFAFSEARRILEAPIAPATEAPPKSSVPPPRSKAS